MQNVAFENADEQQISMNANTEPDPLYYHGKNDDAPLGDFLNRPVQILDVNWEVGTALTESFNPWSEFLTNPNVANKINKFRHLRGKLNLKFMINGNPFLMGRVVAAYQPMALRELNVTAGGTGPAALCQLTARPHVQLNPTTSIGATMKLPFFWLYNWLDLTSFDDLSIGRITMKSMAVLKNANALAGSANIAVFAWMDDVELCTPTNADANTYVRQSEFGDKPVSRMAGTAAKWAGKLASFPPIAPYAKATEMVASGVGDVAHLLGYSRPAVLDPVEAFIPKPPSSALCDEHETVVRLGVETKGELSIDPRTVGLDGTDEMTIPYVAQKMVAINRFEWSQSNITGSIIREARVAPRYCACDTTVAPQRIAFTPLSWLVRPFKYWRGSMKFRISVHASAMHRGRLKISYEPSVGATPADANVVYTRIVDLALGHDFELDIGWHSPQGWLEVDPITSVSQGDDQGTAPTAMIVDPQRDNGKITIEVLTPLISPNPDISNDVTVWLWVAGGPDFEVAVPYHVNDAGSVTIKSTNAAVSPQSEFMETGTSENDTNMNSGGHTLDMIGTLLHYRDASPMVYMGETITSLRQVIRRYDGKILPYVANNMPTGYTWRTAPAHIGTSTPYAESLLTYFSYLYTGWRGSLRYKTMFSDNDGTVLAKVLDEDAPFTNTFSTNRAVVDGLAVLRDSSVAVEIPYYSTQRFSLCRNPKGMSDSLDWRGDATNKALHFYRPAQDSTKGVSGFIGLLQAPGEDFSLFFFTGPPLVYLTAASPPGFSPA